jgi:regulator of protease activity HflC (stomatin/prohibitin superfamily)
MKPNPPVGSLIRLVGIAAGFIVLLVAGCSTFADVPVGSNGVVECASTLTGEIKPEGWHGKLPWCRFDIISIGNNQFKVEDSLAVSQDQQTIKTSANITWTVNPAKLVDIQRKYHGDVADIILAPNVQQALKQATAQFRNTDLTVRRGSVQQKMEDILRERLAPYHDDITIIQLSLTNFTFSDEWQKAVESKVIASQTLATEQIKLQTVRVQADQAAAEASGKARSQAAQQRTLTPLLIQQQWIDKWKGDVPQVVGNGAGMMFGLGGVGKHD